jgi:hypothetical protein
LSFISEQQLYGPVKAFLESQGYDVKGEVRDCDVVGTRGGEPPVIVELKLRFTLTLVLQGIERLSLSDCVYLAVPQPSGRRVGTADDATVRRLCRRLGLGLLVVNARSLRVEVLLDPLPYAPRKNTRRATLLLGEHARRVGDPNIGGTNRTKLVTAYRQEALRCAQLLQAHGPMKVALLRRDGQAPNAGKILLQDVYGWFQRLERGIYALSEGGAAGLAAFAHVLEPAPTSTGLASPPAEPKPKRSRAPRAARGPAATR